MATIVIRSKWTATDTVEIPDDKVSSIIMDIQSGRLPQIVADQIDANGADLTDWEVA